MTHPRKKETYSFAASLSTLLKKKKKDFIVPSQRYLMKKTRNFAALIGVLVLFLFIFQVDTRESAAADIVSDAAAFC